MKKIIFSYLQSNGLGDSLMSIFDILNCSDYIKKIYPDIKIFLIINDNQYGNIDNIFPSLFDIDFFKNFFDFFIIQKKTFSSFSKNNKCEIENETFYRVYSGINYNLDENLPGIFDVYMNLELFEIKEEYNIPFNNFTFGNDETTINIKDFPIFNKNIISEVNTFVEKNLGNNFKSISYRIADRPTEIDIKNFDINFEKFKSQLDKEEKYFISTNHGYCKQKMQEYFVNSISYIPLEKIGMTEINIYNLNQNTYNIVVGSMVELLIHSKSSLIYNHSDYMRKSYFIWYARIIKKVKDIYLE